MIKLIQKPVLFQIQRERNQLVVSFPMGTPDEETRKATAFYIMNWLDLGRNLEPFYQLADEDPILQNVVHCYKGLRIVGVLDLFEALCWAIMGQQVSLHVAYLLKKRFVEAFGEYVFWEGQNYWVFPTFQTIVKVSVQDLLPLKFTQNKAEYILGVAQLMQEGKLSKDILHQYTDLADIEKHLMAIRGIGRWTANYVIMRCLRHPDAFPITDVGLHNALKHVLQLEHKPSLQEVEEWSKNWGHWKAYATFYLWRTLWNDKYPSA
ncbi:DNA-3-methyladenine glycosylase family protein [Collibacillus ludicampi]|uniref:DNA-3-methyladenine glycosylase family protein n=1 Tax=Collibacillus ludicampi TaxID=2771369 RepID=UPI002494E3B3|nr:DNA-3-methyladenine glycosylase [Collibacillus ludicampi]